VSGPLIIKANHDLAHPILHDAITTHPSTRSEYMVHLRGPRRRYSSFRSVARKRLGWSGVRRYGRVTLHLRQRDRKYVAANRPDLGRNEVTWRHVRRLWPEGHTADETLGDYGHRAGRLGFSKHSWTGFRLYLNFLCRMGTRARRGKIPISYDAIDGYSPLMRCTESNTDSLLVYQWPLADRLISHIPLTFHNSTD